MRYTKESLIKDLKHKIKQIKELEQGMQWIMEQYKKGELPE